MKKFLNENWFKLVIVLILLMIGLSAIYYFEFKLPFFQEQTLQQNCATSAAKYFVNNEGENNTPTVATSYKNHFDLKLNKCFILVTSYIANDDFLAIDLYDAVEGAHYATFNGHQICDPTTLTIISYDTNKCQFDSGSIWFDGNDTKNPPDYRAGFGGLKYGGVGDENTLPQFLAHIQPFMTN